MCFKPYAINPKNGAVSSRSIFVPIYYVYTKANV